MNDALREYRITCPYCWETCGIWLEAGAARVELIEDCQVCCHPIQLCLDTGIDGEITVQAERAM